MELRHLRYFIAVVEAGTFTHAATTLNTYQGPLNKQISDLEKEVRANLFERDESGRRQQPLQLTAAGEAFLEAARLAVAHANRTIVQARNAEAGRIGTLNVGINSSIANSLLPKILRYFIKQFPDVKLVLRELHYIEQIEQLQNHLLDVAFERTNNAQLYADLHFIPILEESLVLLLSKEHPLAQKSQIFFRDLAKEKFILAPEKVTVYMSEIINLYTQKVGHAPNVVHEGGWMVTILGLVAANLGVSILPSNVKNLKREGVVYKDILDIKSKQPIKLKNSLALIYRKDNNSQIVRNFQRAIQEVCQNSSTEE
jgi:DNA-binding transcriptional LysR family regulator